MRKFFFSLLLLSFLLPSDLIRLKAKVTEVKGNRIIILDKGKKQGIEKGMEGEIFLRRIGKTEKIEFTIIKVDKKFSKAELKKSLKANTLILYAEILFERQPFLNEEITVRAFRYTEKIASLPASEAVVNSSEIEKNMKSTVASSLLEEPGLSQVGMGGATKAIAVRGMARRRSLVLIDGTKVNSDRRTGPSVHFLSPQLIDRIEVTKGATPVFYGSDALAGVVNIYTKEPDPGRGLYGNLNAGYSSGENGKNFSFLVNKGFGKFGFISDFNIISADDYQSPIGKVPHSGYKRENFFAKGVAVGKDRSFTLTFIQSHGWDIGKPRWKSQSKPTWYPEEDHNIFKAEYRDSSLIGKGIEMEVELYGHPYRRKTHSEKWGEYLKKLELSSISSFDYGGNLIFGKEFGNSLRTKFGVEILGRGNLNASNAKTYFSSSGSVEKSSHEDPIKKGNKISRGAFLSLDYSKGRLDLTLGLRTEGITTSAEGWKTKDNFALGAFSGASLSLSKHTVFFLSAGRAFRVPSLSELYYSGVTGRGYVVGNPDLSPEKSYNIEVGFRFFSHRAFFGIYTFKYWINNIIERFLIEEGIYTYGNIIQGKLKGIEGEFEWKPLDCFSLSGNLSTYKGVSSKGERLNDIPPLRLISTARFEKGNLYAELNYIHQGSLKKPGPAEISIEKFNLLNVRLGCRVGDNFYARASVENILNSTYFSRPDPEAPPEPSRNFRLSLEWNF